MIDGWSDMKEQNIINILVYSCRWTIFLKSIDTFVELLGTLVTADYIHGHIIQAIMDVGPANVVQVVIDNARNCKFMGWMIMEEFPHIMQSPCAAHCLDIMVEDIAKLNWMNEDYRVVCICWKVILFHLEVLYLQGSPETNQERLVQIHAGYIEAYK
jgi:hypothetical protein